VFFLIFLSMLILSCKDFSLHGHVCRRMSQCRVLILSGYMFGMIVHCRILILSGCMFRSDSRCRKLNLTGCMWRRFSCCMCKCGGSIRYWCDFRRSRYSGFFDDRSFLITCQIFADLIPQFLLQS